MSGLPARVKLPAVQPEAECNCHRCGEGVYFVAGVVGPDRWRHVRTGQSRCSPICSTCGVPAAFQIGADVVNGDGALGFRRIEWRCAAHAGGLYIDRV